MRFEDRRDAGRRLGERVHELAIGQAWPDPVVLALPRGGVPVAAEVARALGAPMDVLVARKIGLPGQPEVGIGAIAGEAPPIFDERALRMLGITPDELGADVARERNEVHRCEALYRRGHPAPDLRDRAVVLVDDGLATGVTARAAVHLLRDEEPARVILAVPVGDRRAAAELRPEVDDLVCLSQPPDFRAVGLWYEDFDQVSDDEVLHLLRSLSIPERLRPARHR
ncbi:phosphoribosyltransferase [Streptomyces sp. TRM49041]|uniref:phosphoribosyltransferase n=1 Tax=Streptomyces sp. TRM49041 TaxID=2603216 RepID=UPI0011ECDCEB|nr:phosphoribosyltransferase [Streptomyces sp. TRM49041]